MNKQIILSVAVIILFSAVIVSSVMSGDDSPEDVYALYVAAQRKGDLEGICKYVNDGRVQQLRALPESEQKQTIEDMKKMAPTEYSVITVKIQGDNALLTLSGKGAIDGGSREHRGYAYFIREGGQWKLREDLWK